MVAWGQETHGYTCIFIRFELIMHIHEVKQKIRQNMDKRESSKLAYTYA